MRLFIYAPLLTRHSSSSGTRLLVFNSIGPMLAICFLRLGNLFHVSLHRGVVGVSFLPNSFHDAQVRAPDTARHCGKGVRRVRKVLSPVRKSILLIGVVSFITCTLLGAWCINKFT